MEVWPSSRRDVLGSIASRCRGRETKAHSVSRTYVPPIPCLGSGRTKSTAVDIAGQPIVFLGTCPAVVHAIMMLPQCAFGNPAGTKTVRHSKTARGSVLRLRIPCNGTTRPDVLTGSLISLHHLLHFGRKDLSLAPCNLQLRGAGLAAAVRAGKCAGTPG